MDPPGSEARPMGRLDWSIVGVLVVFLVVVAAASRRHTRSVADFLAAGRCAGRYLISVSEGAAGLGAITLIAFWEMHYDRGFTGVWWNLPNWPILFIIALTGWVTYRFRQTRAMTLAQFFEMRYSRSFRIYAGSIAFLCGVVNFGIFPAVGTRFFIHFCGLPPTVSIAGYDASTFALLMAGLLGLALFFTFTGGQIAIIVTDFVQGIVSMAMLVTIVTVLLGRFEWTQIHEALTMAPPGQSKLNPFDMGEVDSFSIRFFLITYVMFFYNWMAWQGTAGFNCSARSPHEQRMAKVLATWRYFAQELLIPIVAVCAFTFLHHPSFAEQAEGVRQAISSIANDKVQTQMTVPLALSRLLPVGLMGGLCAMMLAAFISNHNSYLHSWGSILVQDVIMPLRGRSLSPARHLMLLRLSILGVAVFIYIFSLVFPMGQYILMFFRVTGSIYLAGAGVTIIGGLYWRRGTVAAAWSALTTGAVLSLVGFFLLERDPQRVPWAAVRAAVMWAQDHFTGQDLLMIISAICVATYIIVSLATCRQPFDLDRMLHRGRHAEPGTPAALPPTGLAVLRMGPDFTRKDKVLFIASMVWIGLCALLFVGGAVVHRVFGLQADDWAGFWHYVVRFAVVMGAVVVCWFGFFGARDMIDLFRRLRRRVRDDTDDGSVR